MSFHPNIPDADDDPSVSQGELRDNFQKMNSDFGINHQFLTASLNRGQHTQIQFTEPLLSDPDMDAPISSLYTKLVSGNPELFFQNGNLVGDVVQLSGSTLENTGTDYSFTTPWGITVKLGFASTSPVTFHNAFPVGFTLLGASISGGTQTGARFFTLTNTGFTYAGAGSVYYLVFGSP